MFSNFWKCSSTWARSAGVTSTWRPVYSNSIDNPSSKKSDEWRVTSDKLNARLARHLSLVTRRCFLDRRFAFARAGNLHLVAVLGDRAARELDAVLNQNLDDLVV